MSTKARVPRTPTRSSTRRSIGRPVPIPRRPGDKVAPNAERTRVALWAHRAIEYLLGVVLITQAVHASSGALVLAAAGSCVALPAAFSGGALSIGRWIGPRIHRVLDVSIAAAIAVAPFVWPVAPPLSFVILEATAGLALWLSFRTQYVEQRRRDKGTPPSPARPRVPAARTIGYYAGRLSRVARPPAERP